MQWQLAIDFGTTNTAAAIRRDGAAVPLRLSSSADQMPSGVLARPDGSLLVGEAAANEAAMYLDSFEPNPKYRLGEEAIYLGGRDISPIELVAAVLQRVGEKGRTATNGEVGNSVVLTHPVAWRQHNRDRLRDAALLAGFDDVRLLSEPIAAARWYATHHHGSSSNGSKVIDRGATLAVFDFGGGTCDVAVLRAADDRAQDFDVLASGGDPFLGGEEFDRLLMDWALTRVMEEADPDAASRMEQSKGGREWFILRDAVRRAKHTLSEAEKATVPFSLGGVRRSLPITRDEFNGLVAPHLDRAMELTRRVFEIAETTADKLAVLPGDAAAMYLTGGSATIPAVHERMRAVLDRSAAQMDDPKTVVPRGALIAPRVDVESVARTVEPERTAASLVRREVEQRRRAEQAARPDTREDAIPQRIRELEQEVTRLREALRQQPEPARPSSRPPPAPPAPIRRQRRPQQGGFTLDGPSARRRRSVWRVLLGLVFVVASIGSCAIGYEFDQSGATATGVLFTFLGLFLVWRAFRVFRPKQPPGGSR